MAELVQDCPRCPARSITFEALAMVTVGYQRPFNVRELFCVCRACGRSTVFKVRAKDTVMEQMVEKLDVATMKSELSPYLVVMGFVSARDKSASEPPSDLPADVEAAFKEGSKCLAAECPNAAAAMFRLSLDLATSPKLPPAGATEPNHRVRRDLGLRLQWLFDNGLLPAELRRLSDCVREDGNDGAHRGTIGLSDAEDLQDFVFALLERLFSEPARLQQAEERRATRRAAGAVEIQKRV